MKFILSAATGKLEQEGLYVGKKAAEGTWMDKVNDFSDWVVHGEVELILKPIGAFLKEVGITLWDWFLINLPDLMGYTTIAAGAFMIISSMLGGGSLMKTMSWYAAAFIVALTILGGV